MTGDRTEYCNEIKHEDNDWNLVTPKKGWQRMNRETAHSKWGHGHKDQLNTMANFYKIKLTGELQACAGCAIVKSRARKTTRTCKKGSEGEGLTTLH